jgi:hypothetical protein
VSKATTFAAAVARRERDTCPACAGAGPLEACADCSIAVGRIRRAVDAADARRRPPIGQKCQGCGRDPDVDAIALQLDHDHSTGLFRGWLCSPCNTALGLLADDPARLQGLLRYLDGEGR